MQVNSKAAAVDHRDDTGATMPLRELRLVLVGMMVAALLSALDNTIVATALPTIVGKLGGFSRYTWLTTVYVATSTISTLVLGRLSDMYGRRRLFIFSIVVLLGGSFLCGAAQTMTQLIVFRGVQGIGGGGIFGLMFATLGDLISPRDRGKYFGLFSIQFGVASLLGPLVGGFIVDNLSWRWVFYVNLPVGLIALFLISVALKDPGTRRPGSIDWPSLGLLTVSVGALVIGLQEGPITGWSDRVIVTELVVAVLAGVVFVRRQTHLADPMLPLGLFKNEVIRIASILSFLLGTMMMGSGLFFALFFQDVRFVTPTRAGLYSLPLVVGMMSMSTTVGRLITRTGRYRHFPIMGTGTAAFGLLLALRIVPTSSYWQVALPMFLIGMGMGLSMPTLSISMQNSAAAGEMGVASALGQFCRSLGSSVGLAVFGAVFNSGLKTELGHRLPSGITVRAASKMIREPSRIKALPGPTKDAITHSLTYGMTRAFLASFIVTAGGFVCAWFLREVPLRHSVGDAAPPAMALAEA